MAAAADETADAAEKANVKRKASQTEARRAWGSSSERSVRFSFIQFFLLFIYALKQCVCVWLFFFSP